MVRLILRKSTDDYVYERKHDKKTGHQPLATLGPYGGRHRRALAEDYDTLLLELLSEPLLEGRPPRGCYLRRVAKVVLVAV